MNSIGNRIPAIAASCLVVTVAVCCLLAILDPTFDASGGAKGSLSLDQSSTIINPLSLMYQPRLPLKGSSSNRQESATATNYIVSPKVSPVQVLVCVEALCIDSQRFFHDQLDIAFNALGHDVMNLTVVSFGNAKLPTSDSNSHNITCQHGFGECDANAFEQCAIHLYPEPAQHIPYLSCLFKALPMGHRDSPFEQWMGLEPCAHTHHLDFELIKQCHNDADLTWRLQQQAAKATPEKHDHVPWVEINGMHMDEDSTTLLREVCKVYAQAGGHTPGCSAVE